MPSTGAGAMLIMTSTASVPPSALSSPTGWLETQLPDNICAMSAIIGSDQLGAQGWISGSGWGAAIASCATATPAVQARAAAATQAARRIENMGARSLGIGAFSSGKLLGSPSSGWLSSDIRPVGLGETLASGLGRR